MLFSTATVIAGRQGAVFFAPATSRLDKPRDQAARSRAWQRMATAYLATSRIRISVVRKSCRSSGVKPSY